MLIALMFTIKNCVRLGVNFIATFMINFALSGNSGQFIAITLVRLNKTIFSLVLIFDVFIVELIHTVDSN